MQNAENPATPEEREEGPRTKQPTVLLSKTDLMARDFIQAIEEGRPIDEIRMNFPNLFLRNKAYVERRVVELEIRKSASTSMEISTRRTTGCGGHLEWGRRSSSWTSPRRMVSKSSRSCRTSGGMGTTKDSSSRTHQ
jgi:hypothetical protein